MATSITIPFWPQSVDCLDWSKDNQIVVVGGENIAIVTPRLREPGLKGNWWETAVVKVNGFTLDELPFTEPLSNAGMSVGEDLSTRQAVAAKWSSPGLARHRRCALAVLTANHVLSIWSADKMSDANDSWTRKMIVNDIIRDYYRRNDVEDTAQNEDARQKTERRQIQQRIRSFCWSPPLRKEPLRKESDIDKLSQLVDWGQHFLAVAAEGGDVFVLRVQSPHERLGNVQTDWKVEIAIAFGVKAAVEGAVVKNHTAESPLDPQLSHLIADHLSWGTWRRRSDATSVASKWTSLAYITAGRLFTTSLQVSDTSHLATIHIQAPDGTQRHIPDRSDLYGPLRTVPGQGHDHVVVFGVDTVFHVDLDDADRDGKTSLHHLDGRWDEVSGVAITNAGDGSHHVHIVSSLTSSTADTSILELPLNHAAAPTVLPAWHEALNEAREAFSAELDLQGNVQERTYGIVASPLGQYVATCVSLHTSDGLEYVIATNQKCTLCITYESRLDEGALLATPRATAASDPVSTEALLFDMQSQYRKIVGEDEPDDDSREVIVADILRNMPPAPDARVFSSEVDRSDASIGDLTYWLRLMLIAHRQMRGQRASRLVDYMTRNTYQRNGVARAVVQQIVEEVAKLPRYLSREDALSFQILTIHATIRARLTAQSEADDTDSTDEATFEVCNICEQKIPMESLRWSKCVTGHEFGRCALSFLSIQEPGTTKSCGICGLQVLNDSFVADATPAAKDIEMTDVPPPEGDQDNPSSDTWIEISHHEHKDPQSRTTLAQLLFSACDVCIYCGGKFIYRRADDSSQRDLTAAIIEAIEEVRTVNIVRRTDTDQGHNLAWRVDAARVLACISTINKGAMDLEENPEFSEVRHRDIPQRWTQITQSLPSPTMSIHPVHSGMTARMESMDSQADFGHRTTDFFDDRNSEDEDVLPGTAITSGDSRRPRSSSPSKLKRPLSNTHTLVSRCEPKRVTLPPEEELPHSGGDQRLDSNTNQPVPAAETISTITSFNGSVDELDLLPDQGHGNSQVPKAARLSSTGIADPAWDHDPDQSPGSLTCSNNLQQRRELHLLAYDILLQGLYSDPEVMQRNQPIQPIASRVSGIRTSMLPQHLRLLDPRSSRGHLPEPGTAGLDGTDQIHVNGKRVHVVPPPIDTSTQRALPADLVRTPYPHTHDRILRKHFGHEQEPPSALVTPVGASESILTLSIRRVNLHSKLRVTSIKIPAVNDYTVVGDVRASEKQKEFKYTSFDDTEFFWQVRDAYKALAGAGRFFSARSLRRIAVSGRASCAAETGYGWLHQSRSPRVLAYKGLTDTFSEEKILQLYRKPLLGKSHFAFVHWAHRLSASQNPTHMPIDDETPESGESSLVRSIEQPEGIEFIVSWSVKRILLAALLVILLSIAAALLWIFLGKSSSPYVFRSASAGFRNSGDRVGTGILIGILIFLIGMGALIGWLGVSWLVM
ncbi:hypothetical protein DOTSEDRAFT_81250 [Dothistroma septosporum NZE10]|uniref:Transcription factor IIIC putative zinc-finger domain-containing protein n=1 Tax=Dothistroma septosporum (strain NZE10 / CBS 128990) TaxID=675120 RepID=N1PLZ0_DOTSN|nr:hypothetical protein DOTSEDRAFT_81250 [Dothistroma septosporum NZE10]